ncbi:MAG: sigma-70 family RNA polymerase sigma factor [Armatimonadota bacterium]|nr:sigma-70 family RNA polymerase sigma factor [Armatimonadota bacterium]
MENRIPSDIALIERAQRGDRDAVDQLVLKYQARAYQFAYRLTGNPDDASDLVAEAFVRVYTALPRFRKDSQFTTWLFRIVTNCFLDQKKKQSRRPTTQLDDARIDPDAHSTIVDQESPIESSERAEREQVMQSAIEELPESQRAMIVMFHVENLSYEDIAGAMDMPIGTVKSRLNRARLALREILEPYEELFTTD